MNHSEHQILAIIWTAIIFLMLVSLADAHAEEFVTQEYIEITEGPESAVAVSELEYLGEFRLTYYDAGPCCNGKNAGIDCFGNKLVWGTVAVDPKVIPLKTHLVIDGFDMEFVARDTGGKWVKGNQIDVFIPVSHAEAKAMNDKKPRAKVWKVVKE